MHGWMDGWMDGWIRRYMHVGIRTIRSYRNVRRLVSHLAQTPTTINSLNAVHTVHIVLRHHLLPINGSNKQHFHVTPHRSSCLSLQAIHVYSLPCPVLFLHPPVDFTETTSFLSYNEQPRRKIINILSSKCRVSVNFVRF
jgi:hypothetical protein